MKRTVIAIVNQKGGSGKSTTAVLLAKSFADAGKTVLLVDCDPQGGSSELFGARHDIGLFDMLMGEDLAPCVHRVTDSLSIVPADFRLDAIFVTANPFALRALTKTATADCIVFDTPPTLQGLTRAAILAADRVLIPSEVSETSFGATGYTIEQVKALDKTPEVMLSGYRQPAELKGTARALSEKYTAAFGPYLVGTLPRSLTAAKMATADGKWSAKTRETIEQPLLALYGGAK